MELTMETDEQQVKKGVRSDRRIPGWAAGLLGRLARDRPAVVTRDDIEAALTESGSTRPVDPTVRELLRLGWLRPLHVKGVWAYLPPGEDELIDPYLDIRGWKARDPDAVFALAGEAAAWHLGYLDRSFPGSVAVWTPTGSRLPHGLRRHLSIVTLGWGADRAPRLGPTTRLLHGRRLDLRAWATGLPAFGPEALVVQLSARPLSFRVWGDLVAHLEQLAEDCDTERLAGLLDTQSASAWQRAAYLLHCGDRHDDGVALLARSPATNRPKVQFGEGAETLWAPDFSVVDHLVAPLQRVSGKA
jgi:AbiEi antitoxin C-terminal domain